MGLSGAKSLLEAKDGLSFLDIIARQVLALRAEHDARLPLVLMDSFSTREDSLAALAAHPDLDVGLPLDFLQNKEPKLLVDGLTPVEWPDDPALEWCPPGHGDLYTALVTSGMLAALLERGLRVRVRRQLRQPRRGAGPPHPRLAARRADAVPDGGHRAHGGRPQGRPPRHAAAPTGGSSCARPPRRPRRTSRRCRTSRRHRYVNTNNLWVDLRALDAAMRERDDVLGLPMIRNQKTVDPSDKSSPAVYQLETAMGAAIEVFEGARALRVPRTRFAPVKTTDDLLALRSDAYALTDDARVVLAGDRDSAPYVALDSEHYKLLRDFEERFPKGPPSLVECERFEVEGDVHFGAGVVARGDVVVKGPRTVEDGTEL